MKKLVSILSAVILMLTFGLLVSSCNNTERYAEKYIGEWKSGDAILEIYEDFTFDFKGHGGIWEIKDKWTNTETDETFKNVLALSIYATSYYVLDKEDGCYVLRDCKTNDIDFYRAS